MMTQTEWQEYSEKLLKPPPTAQDHGRSLERVESILHVENSYT